MRNASPLRSRHHPRASAFSPTQMRPKSRCLLLAFEFLPFANVSLKYTFSLVLLHFVHFVFFAFHPNDLTDYFVAFLSYHYCSSVRDVGITERQIINQPVSQSVSEPARPCVKSVWQWVGVSVAAEKPVKQQSSLRGRVQLLYLCMRRAPICDFISTVTKFCFTPVYCVY